QWRTAHMIIAALLYLLCFLTFYNIIAHSKPGAVMPNLLSGLVFILLPIPSTVAAFSKKIYVEINQTGIYTRGALLTAWQDFIAADYYEKWNPEGTASIFTVRVWHRKQGIGNFEAGIPMVSTLTKSPEEVIAAIKYFYGQAAEN